MSSRSSRVERLGLRSLLLSEPDFAARLYIIVPTDLAGELSSRLLDLGALEVSVVKRDELRRGMSSLAARLEEYVKTIEEAESIASRFVKHVESRFVVDIEKQLEPGDAVRVLEELVETLRARVEELEDLEKTRRRLEKTAVEARLLRDLAKALAVEHGGDASLLDYAGKVFQVRSVYGSREAVRAACSRALKILGLVEHEEVAAASLLLRGGFEELPSGVRYLELAKSAPRGSLAEVSAWAEERLAEAERRLAETARLKREIVGKSIQDYALLKAVLEAESARVAILKHALSSDKLAVASGLVPESLCTKLDSILGGMPAYYFCESEENPPAELRNYGVYKNFEVITRLIGAPARGDWDPTPLLAYAFTIIFGLMVGDVGYGLLLIALSAIIPDLASRFNLDPELARRLRLVVLLCGASSTLAGLAYGSLFGDLPVRFFGIRLPAVIEPVRDAVDFIVYSIAFGWAWLILSYTIGFLKAVYRVKSLVSALRSLGAVAILASGPVVVASSLFSVGLVPPLLKPLVYALLVVGVALVVASKLYEFKLFGLLLWVFDISGIATELLSFMRIAALAFGTALLAQLVNETAFSMAAVFPPLALAILIPGHLLSFGLALVSAFAHTFRLCVYEISMKFYSGDNRFLDYSRYRIPSRIIVSPETR